MNHGSKRRARWYREKAGGGLVYLLGTQTVHYEEWGPRVGVWRCIADMMEATNRQPARALFKDKNQGR